MFQLVSAFIPDSLYPFFCAFLTPPCVVRNLASLLNSNQWECVRIMHLHTGTTIAWKARVIILSLGDRFDVTLGWFFSFFAFCPVHWKAKDSSTRTSSEFRPPVGKALCYIKGFYSPSVKPVDAHKTSKELQFLPEWTWHSDPCV